MKPLHAVLFALLLTVATRTHAQGPPLLVKIEGTVFFQKILAPLEGRIQGSKLDNDAIYDAFSLSKQDYALIYDFSASGVIFRQRNPLGALPDVPVLTLATDGQAIDTRRKTSRFAAAVTSTATGNIFEDLKGTAVGLLSYRGEIGGSPIVEKFPFKFSGSCAHPSGSGSRAVMRFSLKTGDVF